MYYPNYTLKTRVRPNGKSEKSESCSTFNVELPHSSQILYAVQSYWTADRYGSVVAAEQAFETLQADCCLTQSIVLQTENALGYYLADTVCSLDICLIPR